MEKIQEALESVGVHVLQVKYIALAISGMLAAMGGAYMSMGYVSYFVKDMTAGRGFIAIAAASLEVITGADTACLSAVWSCRCLCGKSRERRTWGFRRN